MAIYRKGADPVALRASAERISACSRELDGIRSHAGQAVRGLRGQWGGGDLDSFLGRWPGTGVGDLLEDWLVGTLGRGTINLRSA